MIYSANSSRQVCFSTTITRVCLFVWFYHILEHCIRVYQFDVVWELIQLAGRADCVCVYTIYS